MNLIKRQKRGIEMEKYKLTGVKKEITTTAGEIAVVQQIQALIDIPSMDVEKGDLGGWVQNANSLSQAGECWVFADCYVSDEAKVEENAMVKHMSFIESGAVIRDNARIISSTVRNQSVIDGEALIQGSVILKSQVMNRVIIKDSTLANVSIHKGEIAESEVISMEGRLVFGDETTISKSRLTIVDPAPYVERKCHLEQVAAEKLEVFQVYEESRICRLTLSGKSSLRIGNIHTSTIFERTLISGAPDGKCIFEDCLLAIMNSQIEGNVNLQGWVEVVRSQLTEMASVRNHSKTLLTMNHIKMTEMAQIQKEAGTGSKQVEFLSLGSDTLLKL